MATEKERFCINCLTTRMRKMRLSWASEQGAWSWICDSHTGCKSRYTDSYAAKVEPQVQMWLKVIAGEKISPVTEETPPRDIITETARKVVVSSDDEDT